MDTEGGLHLSALIQPECFAQSEFRVTVQPLRQVGEDRTVRWATVRTRIKHRSPSGTMEG